MPHHIGYNGFLSLELGQYREPERYAQEAKVYLERVIRDAGASLDEGASGA